MVVFDTLRKSNIRNLVKALNEIIEDSFDGNQLFNFEQEENIKVEIEKNISLQH